MSAPLLEIENLVVSFARRGSETRVVRDISFSVAAGKTLAIVGESGSGKSVTCLAALGLTPPPPRCRITGAVRFAPGAGPAQDLLRLAPADLRKLRGARISMIFQEPMTSLNPLKRIGEQVMEGLILHDRLAPAAAARRAVELLDLVGIPDPGRRLRDYPHQLSGGMRQRVMIAMALGSSPDLLIADEPTTALDVTIQAQILDLLRHLQAQTGMAIVFITHNMGVVAEIADDVMVMYAGQIVERCDVHALFEQPAMPYTSGLLHSVPDPKRILDPTARLTAIPGSLPEASDDFPGCTFAPRCRHRQEMCAQQPPPLDEVSPAHLARCHFSHRFLTEGMS